MKQNTKDERKTIYFTIERKPYTAPVSMKRPNATEAEVLKEFPDAKIINSFANGCLKATNAINNKLMTAGIKVENEHLDYSAYWRQVDSIRKEIKEEKDESKKRELEEKLKKFEKENSVRDYGV